MFPIGDDNSDINITPFVTYLIIVLNIVVFLFLQGMGTNENFTYAFSTVPAEILTGQDVAKSVSVKDPITQDPVGVINLQHTPILVYLTLVTSMFMHGGFAHLFGNMLFLWIFGDNLEHAMGHLRFAMFYLACGIVAGLAQVFTTSTVGDNPYIPMLGASGAISGVLGGYIMLFPHRRVKVFMLRMLTEVPAYVALGLWFAFQLISGIGVLGNDSQSGGVAYAAHIGGFIAGLLLIKFFANRSASVQASPESFRYS